MNFGFGFYIITKDGKYAIRNIETDENSVIPANDIKQILLDAQYFSNLDNFFNLQQVKEIVEPCDLILLSDLSKGILEDVTNTFIEEYA